MRPAHKAWIILAAWVIGWDVLCSDGETLSEGADEWMQRHPWLTRAAVATLALHLANAWPDRYDPIHRLFNVLHELRP